ncbi:murein hydrolase activator EnvC family protein [Thiovibrio sp. JS02]
MTRTNPFGRYPFILALSLLLAMGMVLPASLAAEKGNTDSRLLEQQKKIQRIKKGIEGQKSRVKQTREQENSLTEELDRLNQRIQEEGDTLAKLKADLAGHEQLIQAKQAEAAQAGQAKEQAKTHVQARLNAFYRMGAIGVMNVIFSSSDLPELLSVREYFAALLKHDRTVFEEYRRKIKELEQAQLALQAEKKTLVETISQVKSQEEELAASRGERLALLDKVKTEKKLYQLALAELEEASDRLAGTIEELKAAAEKEKKKRRQPIAKKRRPETAGFAAQKGKLSPPVSGTVTTLFGRNAHGKFGITTSSNGIDIKTRPGTEIKAIYDGNVAYVGFLRGYGNLLIIDHGQQYYSLVSQAAKFYKQEGDPVVKGEAIGIMSEQEGLLAEGLHFEIRHGTTPENPLQWVNNAKLIIKAAKTATN